MNKSFVLSKNFAALAIPLVLLGMLIFLIKSTLIAGNEVFSFAITVDLLLTVPLIYYLLIRRTTIPNTTVVPVLFVGLLVGSYFLPKESQIYLSLFKVWALPVLEIVIVTYIVIKVRAGFRNYEKVRDSSGDFFIRLQSVCREILPRGAIMPVVTEIAVFYYGFIHWKPRKKGENEFTYHRENGSISLLVAILFIILIEAMVVHLLLRMWSETAAWILTGLSMYSAFQIFGFLRSMIKRPISIDDEHLYLRYGIMSESVIHMKDIASVELSSREIEFKGHTRRLSILGELESHNLIIHLKNKGTVVGLYGIKRQYKTLALHVDDAMEFKNVLTKLLTP